MGGKAMRAWMAFDRMENFFLAYGGLFVCVYRKQIHPKTVSLNVLSSHDRLWALGIGNGTGGDRGIAR